MSEHEYVALALQLKNVQHDFETPVGEVGVTVRRGFKWAMVATSTQLELWRCERPHAGDCPEIMPVLQVHTDLQPVAEDIPGAVFCSKQGTGRVVGHWVGQLKDLPARIIEQEHEAESRTYSGLMHSLRRAYGPQLSDVHYVTALFYMRQTASQEEVKA